MLTIAEARACLALASFHEILGVLGGARVFGPLHSGLISDLMSFHEQGMENLALILRFTQTTNMPQPHHAGSNIIWNGLVVLYPDIQGV